MARGLRKEWHKTDVVTIRIYTNYENTRIRRRRREK